MTEAVIPPSGVEMVGDSDVHVGLVEYGGDPEEEGFHEPVTVNIDQLDEFVSRCLSFGIENVRMYVRDNSLVLAREQGSDSSLFVSIAPMIVDGNEGDGDE